MGNVRGLVKVLAGGCLHHLTVISAPVGLPPVKTHVSEACLVEDFKKWQVTARCLPPKEVVAGLLVVFLRVCLHSTPCNRRAGMPSFLDDPVSCVAWDISNSPWRDYLATSLVQNHLAEKLAYVRLSFGLRTLGQQAAVF